ncbi:hypothetical protein J3R30DRAFT_873045 [Lentinula aciculospora]|uniref:Uncharacterized protein n=1 Tax=Lentinula aciculospora TaxID=153920 RepID=A0A9W9DW28_9AGAR|nr:hypothetical protein J3R30DRAFT_873045 [Lentinula aciculospora]
MQRSSLPRLSLNLQSLSTNHDFLSQHITPVIGTPLSSTATPTTPRPTTASAHVRRKTYAGDLRVAARSTIHDFEEQIALLESHNSRISVELKATRDALVDECEDRRIERQSLTLPALPDFPAQTNLDSEQSELLYERKLRMEILDTLKKIRAQNMTLSQSYRESQENYASLRSILEAEQREKEDLREEIKELFQRNFTLYEHNKLLVGRDTVLQEEISSLMTKSQADDWMRSILEEELRKQRSKQSSPDDDSRDISSTPRIQHITAPAITLEHQGPLRAQLVAARDDVHIARRCLEVSEKRCEELENRVSSLQRNMTQCLDSSAQALENERELRAEVEVYSRGLEDESSRLKDEVRSLLQSKRKKDTVDAESLSALDAVSDPAKDTTRVEESTVTIFEPVIPHGQVVCGNVQNITVDVRNITLSPIIANDSDEIKMGGETALKVRHQETPFDDQLRVSSTKKTYPKRSTAIFSQSDLFSSAAAATLTDIPAMSSYMGVIPHGSALDNDSAAASASVDGYRSRSSVSGNLSHVAVGANVRTKRDSVILKPLQLSSLAELTSRRLTLHPPSRIIAIVDPSPILPPAPPSTPRKEQPISNKRGHCFRDGSTSSINDPGSPHSSSSTLVASSPASANVDKEKTTLLVTTQKPSFDAQLKSTTLPFLSVDNHRKRKKYQLSGPIATNIVHVNVLPSLAVTHMRTASKVLASIAKRTGIGGLEDCFVK